MQPFIKPGRKSFHESGLASACHDVAASVSRGRLSHAQMLTLRTERVYQSKAWVKATSAARMQVASYFSAIVDTLHASGAIVWVHVLNSKCPTAVGLPGRLVSSPLPPHLSYEWINPEESHFVWSSDWSCKW